jgi:hypothetical protein
MELAIGDWILFLDADERLLNHQNTEYLNAIEALYDKKEVGGVYYNIVSSYKDAAEGRMTCKVNEMCRLVRNFKGFKWIGKAHENIDISIINKNMTLIQSTFKIDHIGYEKKRADMEQKMIRNTTAILNDSEALQHDYYKNILMRDMINLKNLNETGEIKWQH